jgi:S-formylglutathione hydrolase FrmB
MKKWIALVCVLFLTPSASKAQQTEYVSPAGTKSLLYLPPSYQTGTQLHPLLISLHGRGESGNDLTKLTNSSAPQMPARLIYMNKWRKDLPFVVVSPQYNYPDLTDPHPVWPTALIDEVVNYVLANFRIQPNQIYVTGLSMGGFGTWNYAAAYPNKVAAIVPISGRTDLTKACLVKDIPAWVFHGDNDPTVNDDYSVDLVTAIKNCLPRSSTPKLTFLYTKNHNGWNEVYNGTNKYNIYDWLLKFTKGSSVNTPPYVNAGPDLSIKVSGYPRSISGDAFDTDGTLSNIVWRQISGPILSLRDVNSEIFTINKVVAGTFEFELQATDNTGASVTDRMILKIVETSTLPEVTKLFLVNGVTNTEIKEIAQNMVIDKNLLNLSQINIRAAATSNTVSVKFSVNTNRNTRSVNTPGPYFIRTQSSGTEWDISTGEYLICATPYTSTGGNGTPGTSRCLKIKVIEGVPSAQCTGAGQIYREVWAGIAGTSISSIPISTPPTVKTLLYKFESPTDVGDNYGARLRAYVCPPQSGPYIFWIASNDKSELWLSSDSNPSNKKKIAYVDTYTGVRQWTKYATQHSLPIDLIAGTKYYIEALHKEATGMDNLGDNLAVGWQLPDATYERPIPGFRIIPFNETAPLTQFSQVEEGPDNNVISIFPNPAGTYDQLTISGLPYLEGAEASINIYSMTGIELLHKTTSVTSTRAEVPLENRLAPGMYIVKVESKDRKIMKRIIIRP